MTNPYPVYEGCEFCDEESHRRNGCGVSAGVPWTPTAAGPGYAGQGRLMKAGHLAAYGGATVEPWSKTCPQWFAHSPAIVDILSDLDDYEHNRLGPVDELDNDRATYLRIALAERAQWRRWWEDHLMPSTKSDGPARRTR